VNAKAKILAEEVLLLLAFGLDTMSSRSVNKLTMSYEGWLYRNGLLRRLHTLEAQKFLLSEKKPGRAEWVYRLTQMGRLRAFGGCDPQRRWERPWDGWWREIVFDLPVREQRLRKLLVRWLRQNRFGYLQDSVWISPDPVQEVVDALKGVREDAEAFTILECRCASGYSNAALVTGAWPFARINDNYRAYEQFAETATAHLRRGSIDPAETFRLLRAERRRWFDAFTLDPLLPQSLCPADYAGRSAWAVRSRLLKTLAQRTFPAD
jgi:DNA-binding transcriptional regulator PaaX